MQNLSDENEFVVVRENEPVGETHFHMNGITRKPVLTQRQKWPILSGGMIGPQCVHRTR